MLKRKHSAYTLEFKLKILSEVDEKNLSKTEICKKHSIPNLMLSTILKEKLQKIRNFARLPRKWNFAVMKSWKKQCFSGFDKPGQCMFHSGPVIIGKATEITVTSPKKWPKTKLALNQNAFKPKWIQRAPKFRFKVILLYSYFCNHDFHYQKCISHDKRNTK